MRSKKIKPILQEVDYGIVKCKLDDYLNSINISTYELSEQSNIRFQTIKGLRDNTSTRISYEVLAKLCYALNCKIEDIIEYKPNK